MSYQTIIPGEVSESELIALVEQVQIITKSQVSIEHNFVITTENIHISNLLNSLVDALPNGTKPTAPAARRNERKPKGSKVAKKAEVMGPRSMRIEATGEILSSRELKKRIAPGEVAEFATVTNSKGEFVVMDGKLVKGPQA